MFSFYEMAEDDKTGVVGRFGVAILVLLAVHPPYAITYRR